MWSPYYIGFIWFFIFFARVEPTEAAKAPWSVIKKFVLKCEDEDCGSHFSELVVCPDLHRSN